MQTNQLTWLEIDLDAVRQNVVTLKSTVPTTVQFCAVVKSNAYGHGMIPVAQAAISAGADWLAAVAADEAFELRSNGIGAPILVLGSAPTETWSGLAEKQVSITISDREQLPFFDAYHGPMLALHLKVETGLGRLGFYANELPAIVERIQRNPALKLEGISSHFASVEEQDMGYTRSQLQEFDRAAAAIQFQDLTMNPDPGTGLPSGLIRHIAATAAFLQLPESHYDMVRSGIGIYGLWPSADVQTAMVHLRPEIVLTPALSWRTRLVHLKTIPAGMSIGYGRTHTAQRDTVVGVIPVGYADGYDRGLSNKADVLIRGQRCKILGRVAMNMCMVDCSLVSGAKVDDVVTLIGRDGSDEITADDVATWGETINYEIVARIPREMPRHFLE